jgi:hypothetical protein
MLEEEIFPIHQHQQAIAKTDDVQRDAGIDGRAAFSFLFLFVGNHQYLVS